MTASAAVSLASGQLEAGSLLRDLRKALHCDARVQRAAGILHGRIGEGRLQDRLIQD